MKYDNEKIIHSRSMRDFLLANGGVLKKTKADLKEPGREIYIFQADTIKDVIGQYKSLSTGGQSHGSKN